MRELVVATFAADLTRVKFVYVRNLLTRALHVDVAMMLPELK